MRLIGAAATVVLGAAVLAGASLVRTAAAQVPGATSTSQAGAGPLDGGMAAPFDGGSNAPLDAGVRSGSLDAPADDRAAAPTNDDRTPRPRMVGGALRSPDRPGVLRATDDSDAGSADNRVPAQSAPASSQSDVAALRARVTVLEQQLQTQQTQADLQAQTNQELSALRQQIADADAQRQADRQGAAVQQQNVQVAMSALNAAQAQLAGGSTDLGDALDRASASLTGQARLEVESARAALSRSDLYEARQHLAAAIQQAQATGR